jgi:hypothetical protein
MPQPLIFLASLLLAAGAAPLPYGYYSFLRIAACGVFAYAAYVGITRKLAVLPYLYGVLAILFNPLIKIHMTKEIWAVVDLGAALLLLATSKYIKTEA